MSVTLIDDVTLVSLCAQTYTVDKPSLPMPRDDSPFVVRTDMPDGQVVFAFRGSRTIPDWIRDIIFQPIIDRTHAKLGPCHAGFLTYAEAIVPVILEAAGRCPYITLTGHSLGGAGAVGVGALMTLASMQPVKITTFGAPRFGMSPFVNALLPVKVLPQYVRGNDIVPDLPFDVPPFLTFLDTRVPRIGVGVAQRIRTECHHIEGYQTDVTALASAHDRPAVDDPWLTALKTRS